MLAAFLGFAKGAGERYSEIADDERTLSLKLAKQLAKKEADEVSLKRDSLFFHKTDEGQTFFVPALDTNNPESNVRQLLTYQNAGQLYNSGSENWTDYKSALTSALSADQNKIISTQKGQEQGATALVLPDLVRKYQPEFNELNKQGVSSSEINDILFSVAAGQTVGLTSEEFMQSGRNFSQKTTQMTEEYVTDVAKTATNGQLNQFVFSDNLNNSIKAFTENAPIYNGQIDLVTAEVDKIHQGFINNTIVKGRRTFDVIDPEITNTLAIFHENSGGDAEAFEYTTNLLMNVIPDNMGFDSAGLYVATDQLGRKTQHENRVLGFNTQAQRDTYFNKISEQYTRITETRKLATTLRGEYETLGKAGLEKDLATLAPGVAEQVTGIGKTVLNGLGIDLNQDDKELLQKYEQNLANASEEELAAARIQYLNVQLVYVLARLLESPDGGPARLAAADIEIVAKALGTSKKFVSFEQTMSVLNLVVEMTENKYQHLNTIKDVTNPKKIFAANTLHDSLPSLVKMTGDRDQDRKNVLNAIYDRVGVAEEERAYGEDESSVR